jgi:hypothetical protein
MFIRTGQTGIISEKNPLCLSGKSDIEGPTSRADDASRELDRVEISQDNGATGVL